MSKPKLTIANQMRNALLEGGDVTPKMTLKFLRATVMPKFDGKRHMVFWRGGRFEGGVKPHFAATVVIGRVDQPVPRPGLDAEAVQYLIASPLKLYAGCVGEDENMSVSLVVLAADGDMDPAGLARQMLTEVSAGPGRDWWIKAILDRQTAEVFGGHYGPMQ